MKHSGKRFVIFVVIAIFCLGLISCASGRNVVYPKRPRLMVLIVIDQFRADYLTRYANRFLPAQEPDGKIGGFRYLMENGAYYPLGRHEVLQAMTGPGHAILGTGAYPYRNGIALNSWFDFKTGKSVYCAQGEHLELLPEGGIGGHGVSPNNLIGSTIGDALKNAGLPSRVAAVALKDRAAVFLGARRADGVYWFDSKRLAWTTSTYYIEDSIWPSQLSAHNASVKQKAGDGFVWKSEGPGSGTSDDGAGNGFVFETGIGEKNSLWTPFAAELVLNMAKVAMKMHELGQGDGPDLLLLSFSGHDYAGHQFGPNSREMEELTIAEDKAVSDLLNHISKTIPGGLNNALIILTGDHGIPPTPMYLAQRKVESAKINSGEILDSINEQLESKYGPPPIGGDWILDESSFNFYLNRAAIDASGLSREILENETAQLLRMRDEFIYAFTATDVRKRSLPPGKFEKQILNSFFPDRSGDVVAIAKPFYMSDYSNVTHMTGYNYDTTVPIIFKGSGVRKGIYATQAESIDIVPTMAFLAGVIPPSVAEGRVLHEIIARDFQYNSSR